MELAAPAVPDPARIGRQLTAVIQCPTIRCVADESVSTKETRPADNPVEIPVARLSTAIQPAAALVIDSARRPAAPTSTAAIVAAIGLVASE